MEEKRKLIFLILAGLGLYLLSTGASFAVFNYLRPTEMVSPILPEPTGKSGFRIDLTAPKTEDCPLNGAKFTQAERAFWEKYRPLTMMIENHQEARPQSGLSRADIVYEAVAEGGITRFLAIFYCGTGALDVQVGPVRSARTYFLDFASEYGDYPLYAHVGGANTPGPANALGQIAEYGWIKKGNDLNQFSLGFPTFWRDYDRLGHEVATEHTMYSTTDKLYAAAEKRGLTSQDKDGQPWDKNFTKWSFKEEAKSQERGSKSPEFNFWEGYPDYQVKWEYLPATNNYQRYNAGLLQKDLNDDSPLLAKTVIVVFMKETRANDGYENNLHLLYGTRGSGKALVFQDGQAIEGTWNKKDRKTRMVFKDTKGREIKLNQGTVWIEVLPLGSQVVY